MNDATFNLVCKEGRPFTCTICGYTLQPSTADYGDHVFHMHAAGSGGVHVFHHILCERCSEMVESMISEMGARFLEADR